MEIYLENKTLITSKTDLKGHITYGNADFVRFSGYKEVEFLNKPHNIIRHKDMPRIAFKLLWDNVQNGKEFFGFVKNLSREKNIYWVFANITPSFDENHNIIGYYSVRRRPSKEGVKFMSDASLEQLSSTLKNANISYDELVINLQNTAKTQGYH